MMTISSEDGTRLARAKVALDAYRNRKADPGFAEALHEWCEASNAVADELIAAGFADLEGN